MQADAPIACDPSAIAPDEQERWIELSRLIYGAFQELRELPDGYAARLPNTKDMLILLAEDLDMERRCCPFIRYTTELELHHGALWLRWTGADGVKDFLRLALEGADLIDKQILLAAGLRVSDRGSVETVSDSLVTVKRINEKFAASGARECLPSVEVTSRPAVRRGSGGGRQWGRARTRSRERRRIGRGNVLGNACAPLAVFALAAQTQSSAIQLKHLTS